MATIEELHQWLKRDIRRAFENVLFDTAEVGLKFHIFTDINRYTITASDTGDDGHSYLGCVASSRKPRAGEDWHRGNDLADGPLSEETWRSILVDIVGYELVKVQRQKAITAPEPTVAEILRITG